METMRMLFAVFIVLCCASRIYAAESIDPSTLDPTDFASAIKGYGSLVDSKPYADFVVKSRDFECLYHLLTFAMPSCGNFDGPVADPALCCGAIKALVDVDKGKCLCQDRILSQRSSLTAIFRLIQETQCSINFEIPQLPNPSLLPFVLPTTPACEGVPRTAGVVNPDFLTIDGEVPDTNSGELPTYQDLFQPPPAGRYPTSFTVVNITRPEKSVLVNEFSTAEAFGAFIVYPANVEAEVKDPATGAAVKPVLAKPLHRKKKFPIVSFSPGFLVGPEGFLLMMNHIASFGIVVVSQRSSSPIQITLDEVLPRAWANDIAYGLNYLKMEGRNKDSFLYGRVDSRRAGMAGHSFGASLLFPAVRTAADLGISVKAVAPVQPTCVPFSGICDFAGESRLDKLKRVRYLFVAGTKDSTGLVSHTKYFASLVRKQAWVRILEGVNHCLLEIDPRLWPVGVDCGRPAVSPMEAAAMVQRIVGKFLSMRLSAFS